MANATIYMQGEQGPIKVRAVDQGDGSYAVLTSGGGGQSTVALAPAGTLTARNGTVTLGGTAQTLAAANPSRRYLLVQNQSVEALYICFTGAAVQDKTSLKLAPGDAWESPSGFCPTQACSIIGATTGSAFHAVEG
jgi:ABC-type thiamine transport system ATPase subunit